MSKRSSQKSLESFSLDEVKFKHGISSREGSSEKDNNEDQELFGKIKNV
jgi:hypothetical protein